MGATHVQRAFVTLLASSTMMLLAGASAWALTPSSPSSFPVAQTGHGLILAQARSSRPAPLTQKQKMEMESAIEDIQKGIQEQEAGIKEEQKGEQELQKLEQGE